MLNYYRGGLKQWHSCSESVKALLKGDTLVWESIRSARRQFLTMLYSSVCDGGEPCIGRDASRDVLTTGGDVDPLFNDRESEGSAVCDGKYCHIIATRRSVTVGMPVAACTAAFNVSGSSIVYWVLSMEAQCRSINVRKITDGNFS